MAEQPRIYGTADQAGRDPPAAQGMRGENRPDDSGEYARTVSLGDGRNVTIEQDSGVAYAEATGAAGRRQQDEVEAAFKHDPTPDWVWPAAFFALIGLAGGRYLADRRRRSGEQRQRFDERAIPAGGDVGDGLADFEPTR